VSISGTYHLSRQPPRSTENTARAHVLSHRNKHSPRLRRLISPRLGQRRSGCSNVDSRIGRVGQVTCSVKSETLSGSGLPYRLMARNEPPIADPQRKSPSVEGKIERVRIVPEHATPVACKAAYLCHHHHHHRTTHLRTRRRANLHLPSPSRTQPQTLPPLHLKAHQFPLRPLRIHEPPFSSPSSSHASNRSSTSSPHLSPIRGALARNC
jgi:hypothetical protein